MQLLWKTRSEPFGDPSTPSWQVCRGVGWWQVVALRGGGEESASPWCQAHSSEECWRLWSQGSGGSPAWNRYLAAFSTTSGGERAFSSGSSQTSSSWLCSLSHRWERGKVSFLNKCAVPYLLLFQTQRYHSTWRQHHQQLGHCERFHCFLFKTSFWHLSKQ